MKTTKKKKVKDCNIYDLEQIFETAKKYAIARYLNDDMDNTIFEHAMNSLSNICFEVMSQQNQKLIQKLDRKNVAKKNGKRG